MTQIIKRNKGTRHLIARGIAVKINDAVFKRNNNTYYYSIKDELLFFFLNKKDSFDKKNKSARIFGIFEKLPPFFPFRLRPSKNDYICLSRIFDFKK